MKKILYFLIFTFLSFMPILKVNALINNTSTSNTLYAQYDSSYQPYFEWVYNTSDDYLFSKLENYEYKNIAVTFYDYTNYLAIWVGVYGNNDNQGVINGRYSSSITRFQIKSSTNISYRYALYYNYNNNKYYSDTNLTNEIFSITDTNIYYYALDSSASALWYNFNTGSETHSQDKNFIPYSVYYSNMNFVNASPLSNRKLVLYDENDNLLGQYQVGDEVPSWRNQYHGLPSYLTGYEKVGLTPSDNTIIISNVIKGSIYISVEDFNKCNGLFGYFDKDLTSQPYSSVITDYTKTLDGLYIRQDFDLSTYPGADYMYYQKCQIVNSNDNIYKYLWLPGENYTSNMTSVENNTGGLDYTYRVEENGEIIENSFSSLDNILDSTNPLLGNIFQDFSSNTFGLTSIITAPLSLINSLSSSTCSDLSVPLPYINSNLTLPCMSNIYQDTFGSFFTLYQTITFGIVSYWVIVRIWNLVKDFKNPDHDEIEVLDL